MDKDAIIVEQCGGCGKVEGELCKAYLFPAAKWRLGVCPLATHVERVGKKKEKRSKDPLKLSKKKAKGGGNG